MKGKKLFVMAGMLALPALAFAQGDMDMEQGSQHQQPGYQQPGMHQQQHSAQMFKDQKNFRVEGMVSSVDPSQRQITVQRQGLPPAELQIATDTQVKVDGKESSLSQIKPGDEVRAEFNLAENQAIAVSVDAKEGKGSKQRSGSPEQQERPGY
jgi:Cu/Ag efflux protein CusF